MFPTLSDAKFYMYIYIYMYTYIHFYMYIYSIHGTAELRGQLVGSLRALSLFAHREDVSLSHGPQAWKTLGFDPQPISSRPMVWVSANSHALTILSHGVDVLLRLRSQNLTEASVAITAARLLPTKSFKLGGPATLVLTEPAQLPAEDLWQAEYRS